ncbi:MAG: hypothetical protein ACLPY1_09400 [Terracidiphilus sp.]
MRSRARVQAIIAVLVLLMLVCAFGPNESQSAIDADIIVTAAPAYIPLAALKGGERFPHGAQLLLIHAGKAEPLVAGFWAAADANVSFDGQRVLFAGKQTQRDPWQIWELTLEDRSVRKLIAGEGDAIRPFYLPAGRLVYARHTPLGFRLEAAGKDASNALAPIDSQAGASLLLLSYLPANTIPTDVLKDGRILFEAGFPLGSGSTPELYLVYSDGSGVESYRCDHGRARWGGKQFASGDVVFTHGNALARFTSALAHEAPVAAPHAEYAGAIAETASGAWLMSARTGAGAHYALKLWEPGSPVLKTVLAVGGEDLLEPLVVAPRARPKRHPSGLHDWSYANMVALDARQSREGDLHVAPAQVRLESMDSEGHAVTIGTAPVEKDGSFYVRTPADKPIRFALLDAKGAVVRQEHGWFWIRGGEQRYCVGCHTGPERSPENRVPAVLLRTTTPVDLTGVTSVALTTPGARGGN